MGQPSGQLHAFPDDNLLVATKACLRTWMEVSDPRGSRWFLIDGGGPHSAPLKKQVAGLKMGRRENLQVFSSVCKPSCPKNLGKGIYRANSVELPYSAFPMDPTNY